MKIQDSFYYQDFSYVVRVGSAIADWRGSVKKQFTGMVLLCLVR